MKRDREFADEVGKLADAFVWPTHGHRPVRIPFLVTSNIGGYDLPLDAAVLAREQKTLDNFGFNGGTERMLHGAWFMQADSYARPDLDTMRLLAKQRRIIGDAYGLSGKALAQWWAVGKLPLTS